MTVHSSPHASGAGWWVSGGVAMISARNQLILFMAQRTGFPLHKRPEPSTGVQNLKALLTPCSRRSSTLVHNRPPQSELHCWYM